MYGRGSSIRVRCLWSTRVATLRSNGSGVDLGKKGISIYSKQGKDGLTDLDQLVCKKSKNP